MGEACLRAPHRQASAHSTMMQDTGCTIPDENIRRWFFYHEGHEDHEEKE